MADNAHKRPDYLSDSFTPKAKDPAGDPLAELARLIGQGDPFADLNKPGSARKPLDGVRADDRPAPEWLARPTTAHERDESEYDAPRAAPRDHYAAEGDYRGEPYDDAARHDHHGDDQGPLAGDLGHGRYAANRAEPPGRAEPDSAEHECAPYQAEFYQGDDRYRVARPPAGEYEPDAYYTDDGHMPPQADEILSGGRRRGGIVTVVAVLGLAVIGTAGAFGYRAFTSGSGASASPPVIKADTTPAKIVPPAANADAQGKPFQDRIGAPPAPERVVSREEQPVSLPVAPRASAPQPPVQGAPGVAALAPSRTSPVIAPPPMPVPAVNEPKRVRTVTIRPDGSNTETTASAAPPPAPPAPSGTATRSAAPKQQNGPMTIAPQSEPSSRTKVAARPSPTQPAAGGAYVVQVSAQKTEGEAQSSYRALQTKYPTVLAGREASIRRADLGDKGVYYRAQVGPFATSGQANEFCDNLKAAGGQCIVQRN